MFKFYKDTVIDFDKYERYLRHRPYIVFDREKMLKTLQYEKCHADTFASLAIDTMIYKSNGSCAELSKNAILTYLMQYEGCPERYFYNHKTEGASLDAKKVLSKLVNNGHAEEFLQDYMAYKSLVAKNGKISGIINTNTQSAGINKDGIALTKLFFEVNQQKNFRYNYKNSDIIAIPKEYNDCISVEDDYFLAWGDFGQSDFRIAYNLFMRSPENDLIMNAYEDKYEALARMVASYENQAFDYDKFKEERQMYKRLTLATVYGTRDSIIASEQPFIKRLTDFLYKCEKYVEYEKRIKDRIDLNLPVLVDSYFGNMQSISGKYRAVDLLNDALNAPVQTGTSEIVALTTMQILEEFYKLGYTEDEISVYYVRHDEPVFRVHKNVLKDAWVFNQFNQILIDDWTPLRMDFNFGYYYKQADEELEKSIHEVYDKNLDKIVNIPVGNTINDFYPAPPIYTITASKIETPDNKVIYGFYVPDSNAIQYNLLQENEVLEQDYVLSIINKLEPIIYEKGYRGIRILVDFLETGESFLGQSYIGIKNLNDNSLSKVKTLLRYMYCRYCKSKQIAYDENITPLQCDAAFIESVSDLKDVLM